MKVFLTGGSGYIGSRVTRHLVQSGHDVTALVRSIAASSVVTSAGASSVRGDLDDVDSFVPYLRLAEAVVHIPASHDFHDGVDVDRVATEAIVKELAGTGRRLVYTSGARMYGNTKGRSPASETAAIDPPESLRGRALVEELVLRSTDRYVQSAVVRPTVTYGHGASNPVLFLINSYLEAGRVASFVGDGSQQWSFVHVDDLAALFGRLVDVELDGTVFNAAAGPPVSQQSIAASIVDLGGGAVQSMTAEQAVTRWGEMGEFVATDLRIAAPASEAIGWKPQHPGFLEDLAAVDYRSKIVEDGHNHPTLQS